jgi:hypothetical protein
MQQTQMQSLLQLQLGSKPFGRNRFAPVCRVTTKPVTTKGKTVVGKTAKGKTQSGTVVRTVRGQQQSRGPAQPEQQGKRRGSRFYFNITGFPFPLGPFFERQTVRTEVSSCSSTSHAMYVTIIAAAIGTIAMMEAAGYLTAPTHIC